MRQALVDLLTRSGYLAESLEDAALASSDPVAAVLNHTPDLILLDINLPGLMGTEFLKLLRQSSELPVIMLTSSSAEVDEVLSMTYGADDFLTKPYSPNVLLLHIAAVLRRSENHDSSARKFHHLKIDLARGVIENTTSDKPQRALLTKNEMIILRHLLDSEGNIVTREALMTDLWNNQEYINDNALTVNVSRLRAKFKALGAGDVIETRKNLGYILS